MQAIILFLLPLVYAAPTLPFPPPVELTLAEVNANTNLIVDGGRSNVSCGATYSPAGIMALQLLATLKNIEAYLYADAIQNITTGVYTLPDNLLLNDTIEVISKIAVVCMVVLQDTRSGVPMKRQQEAAHVATAGAVLGFKSAPVVPPCNYTFPVTNFEEFLAVANLITCTNFGSVIGVQKRPYHYIPDNKHPWNRDTPSNLSAIVNQQHFAIAELGISFVSRIHALMFTWDD